MFSSCLFVCPSVCLCVCYYTREHSILKMNELMLMPTCTSGQRGKGMKQYLCGSGVKDQSHRILKYKTKIHVNAHCVNNWDANGQCRQMSISWLVESSHPRSDSTKFALHTVLSQAWFERFLSCWAYRYVSYIQNK